MYVCKSCARELDEGQFYAHPRAARGHHSTCKDCTRARVRTYRSTNADQVRAYDRWRGGLPHRKAAAAIYQATHPKPWVKKEWRSRNLEKGRAHTAAQKIPLPDACQQCGASSKLHRHHPDYTKPLLVEFLCPACHGRVHREARGLPVRASRYAETPAPFA